MNNILYLTDEPADLRYNGYFNDGYDLCKEQRIVKGDTSVLVLDILSNIRGCIHKGQRPNIVIIDEPDTCDQSKYIQWLLKCVAYCGNSSVVFIYRTIDTEVFLVGKEALFKFIKLMTHKNNGFQC